MSEPMDLTPRADAPVERPRTRRWWAIGLGALLVLVAGWVLWNGLSQATVFFYNVDEAVERQDEFDGQRLRVQGNVVEDSIARGDGGVSFVLTFAGAEVPVAHSGEPPELFGSEIPVVVEGEFAENGEFRSDRILVRHDSTYEEENHERLNDAEADIR